MPIPATITIDLADRTALAQTAAVLLALASTATPTTQPADLSTEATRPARARGNKATAPAAPATEAPASPAAPATEAPAAPVTEAQVPTADDLRKALLAVLQNPKAGAPAAAKVMAEFGAANATSVKAEQRAAVIARLNAVNGEAK